MRHGIDPPAPKKDRTSVARMSKRLRKLSLLLPPPDSTHEQLLRWVNDQFDRVILGRPLTPGNDR